MQDDSSAFTGDTVKPDQGVCPKCGHINEAAWVLCDACGERLPWAQAPKAKPNLNDLSTEQLSALFAVSPKRERSLLLDRRVQIAISIIISIVLTVLFHR